MANPGKSRRDDGRIPGKAAETAQRTVKAAHLPGEAEESARTLGRVGLGIRPWPSMPPLAARRSLGAQEEQLRSTTVGLADLRKKGHCSGTASLTKPP